MSNLRICNAVSLHPRAASNALDDIQPYQQLCVLGCLANKSELCEFPVHDVKRCNNWLRHFGVSNQLVKELGGLQKLRICFKHFTEHKEMAKTRIKMTPLRTGTSAVATGVVNKTITTTTTVKSAAPPVDGTTIELIDKQLQKKHQQQHQQQQPSKSVTTITAVPQRSHSICSSGSSDVQSIGSDYEASMPLSTLINGNATQCSNGNLKKRKLYVITEKSDKLAASDSNAPPQQRKMFVVVEEENETKAKKLMFVTDKPPQGNISEHLEKFLPEILNCIQDKQQAKQQQEHQQQQQESQRSLPLPQPQPTPAKPHITLPPKKNPTNFVKAAKAAAPTMPPNNNHHHVQHQQPLSPPSESDQASQCSAETNINLSPDFRFLMKILPKLEQLPEQHKQNVKRSIQIFVEKSYSMYANKD